MTSKQEAQGEAVPDREPQNEAVPDDGKGEAASERQVQREAELEDETEPQTLELTDGPIPPSTVSSPYSIDRDREQKRGWIALILVGLLAAVIILSFIGLFLKVELKDLKELLTIILSPLVALVGAATGFYFGEKNKGKS